MTYIRGAGGGGGKGGGGNRTPHEADDSLQSVQWATVVDLLSEGEIQGLDEGNKSIYLDGTPVLDSAGNENFEGWQVATRNGTQDQTYISEAYTNESEQSVGVKVTELSPVTRQITNTDVDRVRVTIKIPSLRVIEDDGDIVGHSVEIKISMQYNGGGYTTVKTDKISGKASNAYFRDYVLPVSGAFPVDIKVERVSEDETLTRRENQTWWSSYTEIIDEKLRYPNSALTWLRFDARSFNSIPRRKYLIRGIKVKLPSNATVDTTTHKGRVTYSGVWDGSWKAAEWCADPAWCLYDLLISTRYGPSIPESTLDKWDFYSISQYCNELVADGKGSQEPRFLCNLYINDRAEVYDVIKQMCSLFRGISYYGAGSVVLRQDKPEDSQYLIGPANVVDGMFEYSGTSQKARHTTCTVAFQTYDNQGEVQFQYVEDADAISKYGILNKEVKALGCYSQGQAHRLGMWLLKSEQILTQTVSFGVSIDSGLVLRPGIVVDIADPTRAGSRRSGRISSATTTAITIDSTDDLSVDLGKSPKISVMMPTGLVEQKTISGINGRVVSVIGSFSEAPNAQALWLITTSDVQSQKYRILSVVEAGDGTFSCTGLEYNESLFANVDAGEPIVMRDISNLTAEPDPVSDVVITEFLYSQGQGVFVGVDIGWNHNRKRVTEYRVQYKQDDDNWVLIQTGSPSVTIRGIREGNLYVQIQAYNYLNKGSTIVTANRSIAGKTAAPENVQNLMMIPTNGMARLFWDQCADLDVIVGGWVRVRHSPDTNNVTWATSTSIHADLPGSAKEAYCDLKGGTYLAKFVDSGGRTSVTPTLVEFTKPDLYELETVNTQQEHNSYPGTKTNLLVDSPTNELRMNVDGGTSGGNATFHTTGTYLFQNNPIDLGDVYSVRLESTLKVRSYFPYNPFVDTLGADYSATAAAGTTGWDALPSVDGNTPDTCDVKLYVRTTQVANPQSSDWTSWRLFHNAEISARKYELKAEFVTGGKLEQIAVQQLKVETKTDLRTIRGSATSSTSADVAQTFGNKFMATPAVGISFSATTSGDYYTLASTSATGFSVSIYNAAGARQARAFQWMATGYGKG